MAKVSLLDRLCLVQESKEPTGRAGGSEGQIGTKATEPWRSRGGRSLPVSVASACCKKLVRASGRRVRW